LPASGETDIHTINHFIITEEGSIQSRNVWKNILYRFTHWEDYYFSFPLRMDTSGSSKGIYCNFWFIQRARSLL